MPVTRVHTDNMYNHDAYSSRLVTRIKNSSVLLYSDVAYQINRWKAPKESFHAKNQPKLFFFKLMAVVTYIFALKRIKKKIFCRVRLKCVEFVVHQEFIGANSSHVGTALVGIRGKRRYRAPILMYERVPKVPAISLASGLEGVVHGSRCWIYLPHTKKKNTNTHTHTYCSSLIFITFNVVLLGYQQRAGCRLG